MNQQEQRQIALRAARGESRHHGLRVDEMTADNALDVLDDLTMMHPTLIASKWYAGATQNQLRLFRLEWNQRQSRGY